MAFGIAASRRFKISAAFDPGTLPVTMDRTGKSDNIGYKQRRDTIEKL